MEARRGAVHVLDWIHGWISGPNFKFDLNWIQQPNLDCQPPVTSTHILPIYSSLRYILWMLHTAMLLQPLGIMAAGTYALHNAVFLLKLPTASTAATSHGWSLHAAKAACFTLFTTAASTFSSRLDGFSRPANLKNPRLQVANLSRADIR